MTNAPSPVSGHRANRTSNSSPHAIAATARVYMLDDFAPTRRQLLAGRGWDQRHRRYRRRASTKG